MTAIVSRARILERTALTPDDDHRARIHTSLDESAAHTRGAPLRGYFALPHKAAFGALTPTLARGAFVIRPRSSFVLLRRGRVVTFELVSDEPGHILLPFLRRELKQPLEEALPRRPKYRRDLARTRPLRVATAEEPFSCCP
jgi:hypothetical protein